MTRISLFTLILALFALASPARAGSLDMELLKKAPDILDDLIKAKIKTVGVLPFKVQRGSRTADYVHAPIATNITNRLENSLIVTQDADETKIVKILRDVGTTAARLKVGDYTASQANYKKLFEQKYDLAWGERQAHADGFLTGIITNTGEDRSKTKVTIQLLDEKSMKAGKITPLKSWEMEVRTDRMLLSDLGYNFSLSRDALKKTYTVAMRDRAATTLVAGEDEKSDFVPGPGASDLHSPANVAGFSFELRYDNKPQRISKLPGGKAADYVVASAKPGAKITMHMTRLDKGNYDLGVVLMVNGKNTFDLQDYDAVRCRKWLYGPAAVGLDQIWEGFYTGAGGKDLLRFKSLSPKESIAAAKTLGPKAGWIDVYVFASREKTDSKPKPKPDEKPKVGVKPPPPGVIEPDEAELMVSVRSTTTSTSLALAKLQDDLRKRNNLQMKKSEFLTKRSGGLIVHEMEPVPGVSFESKKFANPEMIGHLAIRYYEVGDLDLTTD